MSTPSQRVAARYLKAKPALRNKDMWWVLLALYKAGDGDPKSIEVKKDGRVVRVGPHHWNFLNNGGWVQTTPELDRHSREWPEWVEITTKGVREVMEIQADMVEEAAAKEAHDKISRLVEGLKRKYPTADLSLGYLGNYTRHGDQTSWYVFSKLSQPGSYGHKSYKWGGYGGYRQLPKLWKWAQSNLATAVADAVANNDGPYRGPAPRYAALSLEQRLRQACLKAIVREAPDVVGLESAVLAASREWDALFRKIMRELPAEAGSR